jgi:hypothetical protein
MHDMGKRRFRGRLAPEEKVPADQAEPAGIANPPAAAVGNAAIGRLLRSATSTGPQQAPEGFEEALNTGGGQPIPAVQRSTLEAGLGTSLSGVRLHTGSPAAELASSVSAKAFTVGQDVYFGQGEYRPDSQSGYHLLAHEVTHTVQQSGAPSSSGQLEVSTPDSAAERHADHVADQLASGQPASVAEHHAPGVHRKVIQRVPAMTGTAERELDAKWQIKPSGVDKALADTILGQKALAMTFYTAYETGLANDNHFKDLGVDFAKTYKTLGMTSSEQSGGALQMGVPIPVKSRGDVEQAITSVAQTVHLLANERQGEDGAPVTPPQIRTVAIFAHGVNKSLGIDPKGETGGNWFKAKEIKSFVGAIRGRVSGDVQILLYACSAGGTPEDPTVKDSKARTESGGPGGADSFAAQLAAELGGEAKVFAHNIYDHAEANPQARQFTADSALGKHMFDVIYGDEFLQSEARRLGLTAPEATAKLRKEMWEHYYDAVKTDYYRINSNNRHFQIGGYGGVGAAMFMDPDTTTKVLREDFTKFWLNPNRIKALTSE